MNPFKVLGSGRSPGSSGPPRVTNVLDSMTSSGRKPSPLLSSGGKQARTPVLKPLVPKTKTRTKTQSTLFQSTAPRAANKKPAEEKEPAADRLRQPEAPPPASAGENVENKRPATGFQLWLEEKRKGILAEHPDLGETEVIKEAMGRFRSLTAEDRMTWTERAKGVSGEAADLKKRKRGEEGGQGDEDGQNEAEENSARKKKTLDPSAKLSAFAFNKN